MNNFPPGSTVTFKCSIEDYNLTIKLIDNYMKDRDRHRDYYRNSHTNVDKRDVCRHYPSLKILSIEHPEAPKVKPNIIIQQS